MKLPTSTRLVRLLPLMAAGLLTISSPASAGHGMPYGHPPCHGPAMYGQGHGMYGQGHGMYGQGHGMHGKGYGAHGSMYGPGHHGMYGKGAASASKGYAPGEAGYADKAGVGAQADILDTATAAGSFTTLAKAVAAAGLTDTLRGAGPFTVFAPTDAAFAKLPQEKLDALLADKDKLTAVLTYHVAPGRLSAADLLVQGEVKTVQGQTVPLSALDVVKADIATSNGIIHVIDSVLLPTM